MIFAQLVYPECYQDIHDGIRSFIEDRFEQVESGLQGDSWIWIWIENDKVEIDTFSSMKHQIKSSRAGSHVDSVIDALKSRYTIHEYPNPEPEPHEDS